ncbi:MAG: AMP-binding protein, partial [bacterium]|nr:AMP-binding protein [bacterium]
MMSDEEIKQLVVEFNDTTADYPRDKTIHQLFEEQVEKTPDNIGLGGSRQSAVGKEKTSSIQLTYRELNEKANRLARHLQSKGVEPGIIVAIMVERSIEMIVGLLGILKAGAAYLPIDPTYPEERINYMLKDSNVKIFLKEFKELREFGELNELKEIDEPDELGEGIEMIDIQTIYKSFTSADPQSPITKSQPSPSFPNNQSPAYIIYTSGTTGKPKGVMIA